MDTVEELEAGRLLMLELQVGELESKLERAEDAHRRASSRANTMSKRNDSLKEKIRHMENDMRILSQCWSCQDLGQRDKCSQCANSAVMVSDGSDYVWRGFLD